MNLHTEEAAKRVSVENKDQAQALANFLWNELERHTEDIIQIHIDLETLYSKWGVVPVEERKFVVP